MKSGILYIIGVGPGAPDLLTVRASKILAKAQVVLAAASSKNDYSLCLDIIKDYLTDDVEIARLNFPMSKDRDVLANAWHCAVQKTTDFLDDGKKCVFVTLGDPLFYSTFIHLSRELLRVRPETSMEIIPGITSFQAASAKTQIPLGQGEEILQIVPGTLKKAELEIAFKNPNPLVIIKAYRNLHVIMECLEKTGRLDQAILVSRVEQEGEKIICLKNWHPDNVPPYMSLILSPVVI